MTTLPRNKTLVLFLATLALAIVLPVLRAGDLEPPGPPGSTMKPLFEVEPRHPIHAGMLPLHIVEPGSYYLAENIDTPAGSITISSSDVTLDLNGFALVGAPGACIEDSGWNHNITIRNGTIRACGGPGVSLETSEFVRIEDLRVEFTGGTGIVVSDNAQILDSTLFENAVDGIFGQWHIRVQDCHVGDNTQDGISVFSGIITGNEVYGHERSGIHVLTDSIMRGNNLTLNGHVGHRGAIWVEGTHNHVEDNRVSGNWIGIDVDSAGNAIMGNVAIDNYGSANYDIIAGNCVGPIETSATSAGPWANFSL